MDTKKLIKLLTEDESLKDIPIIYVFRVTYSVLKFIKSGECLYTFDID